MVLSEMESDDLMPTLWRLLRNLIDGPAFQGGVSLIQVGVTAIEPRILIAYAIILFMVGAAVYFIARFKRERARRRDIMRGKYREN